jgi:hypothetical protein
VQPSARPNIVGAEQHVVEIAPDNLAERWRCTVSAAAEDVVVLDSVRPVRKHLPFEAAVPEIAMEIHGVGINVTVTRY